MPRSVTIIPQTISDLGVEWTNVLAGRLEDGACAARTAGGMLSSHLRLSGFVSDRLPDGATILGLTLRIKASGRLLNPPLLSAQFGIGEAREVSASTADLEWRELGGAADLWDFEWTAALLAAAELDVWYIAVETALPAVDLDAVELVVTFEDPSGPWEKVLVGVRELLEDAGYLVTEQGCDFAQLPVGTIQIEPYRWSTEPGREDLQRMHLSVLFQMRRNMVGAAAGRSMWRDVCTVGRAILKLFVSTAGRDALREFGVVDARRTAGQFPRRPPGKPGEPAGLCELIEFDFYD